MYCDMIHIVICDVT